jgi:hypothetical protein
MKIKIEQLNVETFGGCNYRCAMCPQSAPGGRGKDFGKMMPFSIFEKIVLDAMQYGLKSVSLHGSGEATLHLGLIKMVEFLTKNGLYSSLFTNGLRLNGDLFEKLLDAGFGMATVSMVGADRAAYHHWMSRDAFDEIMRNLRECNEIMERHGTKKGAARHPLTGLPVGVFHTRHLITAPSADTKAVEREVEVYRRNIIDPLGCYAEIWMMHNWADQYGQSPCDRASMASSPERRSCGRPFAATLEVRAGGLEGHHGAVVPCPFTLGPKDAEAVLGNLDVQTIAEVMADEPIAKLRQAHMDGRFDDIPACRGCDMLYQTEVLAWSNIPGRHTGQSKTSNVDYVEAGKEATAIATA